MHVVRHKHMPVVLVCPIVKIPETRLHSRSAGNLVDILRETIVNRTHGTDKNVYIVPIHF